MDFLSGFSLQDLAMISYSTSFWKRPKIQAKLRILIIRYMDPHSKESCNYKEARKHFLKNLSEELKSISLPSALLSILINIVNFLGLRIMYWYEYLCFYGIFPYNCIKNLQWTNYGTFDEANIIETELLKPDIISKNLKYHLACCYIQKNYLKQHCAEIIASYQKLADTFQWHANGSLYRPDYHFILSSASFLEGHNDSYLKKIMEEPTCSKEQYMFRLAVRNSTETAIRYYWQILREKTARELTKAALQIFKIMTMSGGMDFQLLHFRHLDCLAFLLMQMSELDKQDFFFEFYNENIGRCHLFGFLITFPWPVEKFFSPMFDILNRVGNKDKGWYNSLLVEICQILDVYHSYSFDVKNIAQYKMFFAVFNEIQIRFDDDPFFVCHTISNSFSRILKALYNIFDIKMLNAVLNFACVKSCRKMALCAGSQTYKELIVAEEYSKLNMFMEAILISQSQRKWFQGELLYFVPDFILEGRFHVADRLLDWGLSSEEEKKLFKNELDIMSICAKIYFKTDPLLAGKILKWFFPNDEDKKTYVANFAFHEVWGSEPKKPLPVLFVTRFRNEYENLKSIRPSYLVHPEFELLNIILAEGEKKFIDNTEKYFNWFFNSNEEVDRFKKEILLNECILKNFVKNTLLFYHHHHPKFIKKQKSKSTNKRPICIKNVKELEPCGPDRLKLVVEYLKFCNGSCELLKNKIFRDIDEWIIYLTKNYVGVDQIDYFLDWILKEQNKQLVIKKFLLSSKTTEFFDNLVRHHNMFSRYEDHLVAWIQTLDAEKEIENLIDLSVIETSLMNNYHWEYCRVNGMEGDKYVRIGDRLYSYNIPCGCYSNIQDLKDIIETLKNKRDFNFKMEKHRTRWMDDPHDYYVTKLYFSPLSKFKPCCKQCNVQM